MKTKDCITRYPGNPVLSHADVPFRCSLAFNAGVTRSEDRYVMIFRNDIADRPGGRIIDYNFGIAFSDDGIKWHVRPEPLNADPDHPLRRASDPRLHVLEDRFYLTFSTACSGTCTLRRP